MSINPSEVFNKPVQIGMIVEDLDRSLKFFESFLGFKPRKIVDITSRNSKGDNSEFVNRCCFIDLGNIEFELIQPLSGKSMFTEFIEKYGSGLHHLKFKVQEHGPIKEHFESKGIELMQSGPGVGKNEGKTWVYYDTKDTLGFYIELID